MWPFTRQTNIGGKISSPANIKQPSASASTVAPVMNRTKPTPATTPSAPMTSAAPENKAAAPAPLAAQNFVSGPPRRLSAAEAQEQAEEARAALRKNTDQLYADRAEAEQAEVQRRKAAKASAEAEAARLAAMPPSFEQQFKPWRTEFNGCTPRFVDWICERAGLTDFAHETREKLAPHCEAFREAQEELLQHSARQISNRVREIIVKNTEAGRTGDIDNVQPLPDKELLEREGLAMRGYLRERLRGASVAAKPLIAEFSVRLEEVCRKMASDLYQKEMAESEVVGVPFAPSSTLAKVISAGYEIREFLDHSFIPGPLSDPAHFILFRKS